MGKLNIAHHKSYHPYRRDNIERVRRDEEEARLKEAHEEQRVMLADAEARVDLLRDRAGVGSSIGGTPHKSKRERRREEEAWEAAMLSGGGSAAGSSADPSSRYLAPSGLPTERGHINFFKDLEQETIALAIQQASKEKKGRAGAANASTSAEDDKGVPLAPSAQDLNPWYVSRTSTTAAATAVTTIGSGQPEEVDWDNIEEKALRDRELARKSMYDPLTSINRQLAASTAGSSSNPPSSSSASFRSTNHARRQNQHSRGLPLPPPPPPPPPSIQSTPSTPTTEDARSAALVEARLTRESSERRRALELIQRKRREARGSATPSTVRGDDQDEEYGNLFNPEAVHAAHRYRHRELGRERQRGREREREQEQYQRRRER